MTWFASYAGIPVDAWYLNRVGAVINNGYVVGYGNFAKKINRLRHTILEGQKRLMTLSEQPEHPLQGYSVYQLAKKVVSAQIQLFDFAEVVRHEQQIESQINGQKILSTLVPRVRIKSVPPTIAIKNAVFTFADSLFDPSPDARSAPIDTRTMAV